MIIFKERIKNPKRILDNNRKQVVTLVINRGYLRNCLLDFSDFTRQASAHLWWKSAWCSRAHLTPLYPKHLDSATLHFTGSFRVQDPGISDSQIG